MTNICVVMSLVQLLGGKLVYIGAIVRIILLWLTQLPHAKLKVLYIYAKPRMDWLPEKNRKITRNTYI